MEEKQQDVLKNAHDIDVNNPEFYENVQAEIDSDLARMKKTVDVMLNLRLTAAEVEVETAALFHAELWYDLLDIHDATRENSEEEDNGNGDVNKTKNDS